MVSALLYLFNKNTKPAHWMHDKAQKKLFLQLLRPTELELSLRATEIVFSTYYQETSSFEFTKRFGNYIGWMRFELHAEEDYISFYCPWKLDKIAELRVLNTSNQKL